MIQGLGGAAGINLRQELEGKRLYLDKYKYPDNYIFREANQEQEMKKIRQLMAETNTDITETPDHKWYFNKYPVEGPLKHSDDVNYHGLSYVRLPSRDLIEGKHLVPPEQRMGGEQLIGLGGMPESHDLILEPMTNDPRFHKPKPPGDDIPKPLTHWQLANKIGPDYARQLAEMSGKDFTGRQPPIQIPDPGIRAGLQELEEQSKMLERVQAGEGENEPRGGLTLPKHRYVGPGGELPAGRPMSKLDEIAARHDIGYHTEIKHGHNPYYWYNFYDEQMIKDIKDNMDTIANEGESWLANFILSTWKAKASFMNPLGILLEHIQPDWNTYYDPTNTHHKQWVAFQRALTQHGTVSTERPATPPPADPDTSPPPAKKQRTESPNKSASCSAEMTSSCEISSTQCTNDEDMEYNQTTVCGMPSSTTDSTIGNTGVQGTGDCAGGGGGSQRCTNKWLGGISWGNNTFTTYQTRRCILQPFTNKYTFTSSVDSTPGITVTTPWYYIDLNCFYSHIPPSTMQEIIETTDGFKPLTLTVTITEIVGKDVSCTTTSSGVPNTVTDSQTATILLHRDDHYELPYVLGGGQETVPEHLPGDWYKLPQYCYTTVGMESPWGNWSQRPDDCSGNAWTVQCTNYFSTQDSELFLLENLVNTQLHPGCSWTSTYRFPHLPMAYTTQYPWSTRRQDNPLQKQRIVAVRNCCSTQSTDVNKTKQVIEVDQDQADMGFFRKPTMWLPANRHRDGDCQIIPPKDRDFHLLPVRSGLPPVIVVRQGIFNPLPATGVFGLTSGTEQPGPPTEDKAVRTPGGTTVLTSNTLTVKRKHKYKNQNHDVHTVYEGKQEQKRLYQLVIQTQRGVGGPAEPDHVQERIIGNTGEKLPGSRYPLQSEITYGQHTGAVEESESGFYEFQIWERNPNTDLGKGGHKPPLAQWAMEKPPPTIYLRMLPMPCAPCKNKYTKSPGMKGIINSYVTFQLQYSIKWAYTPRTHTRRWNPTSPALLPPPLPGSTVVYNLDSQKFSTDNQYTLAAESWQFKNRLRHNR
ncbi:structural protein [bovine parvovirus 2]|uniref:Structural protein n=1 Tax=bovine parvovirus 2 TaxID=172296 RepID=A0A2I7YUU3_9VIRU|nr:structural protein [bovine parvovirus 2]